MAARALKLRWLVYVAGLRAGWFAAAKKFLIACVFVTLAAGLGFFPVSGLLQEPHSQRFDALIIVLLQFFVFLGTFATGNYRLSVRQFSIFPTPKDPALSVFLSSFFAPVTLLLWVYLLVRCISRLLNGGVLLPELIAASALLVNMLLLAVLGAALTQRFFATGLAASLQRWISILLFFAIVPLAVFVCTETFSGNSQNIAAVLDPLRFMPWGYPIAITDFSLRADILGACFVSAVWLLGSTLLYAAYYFLAKKLLSSIERPVAAKQHGQSMGVFNYFPDTPAGVIAARTLIYWRRDPRYFVGLLALPVAAFGVVFAMYLAGMELEILVFLPVPIVLYLLGWSIHNDIGMDSTAIWVHVASNTRGIDDRLGRLTPLVLLGTPILVFGSTLSVLLVGKWYIFPAIFGLNAALLLIGAGISTLASAWAVYPVARPGDSPFAQPLNNEAYAVFAQAMSFIAGLLLALPTVLLAVNVLLHSYDFMAVMFTLVVGLVSGALVLGVCIIWGGMIFERTAPEIVRVTEVYD